VSRRPDGVLAAIAAKMAPMRWRLVGTALALAFYAGLWVLVAAGATSLEGVLITFPVIVALIAGGNWLQHWLGIQRRAPQFSGRTGDAEHEEGASST
jgi:hypothetical protein